MQPNAVESLAALLLHDPERFDEAARSLAEQIVDFPITGTSMGATLPKGTIVRVELAGACQVGDIALFRHGAQIVAHRVIHRGRAHLITRGDARFAPDPPVEFDRVIGRVVDPRTAPRRHPVVTVANGVVRWVTAAALRVSPALAAQFARLLTRIERA